MLDNYPVNESCRLVFQFQQRAMLEIEPSLVNKIQAAYHKAIDELTGYHASSPSVVPR